MADRKIDVEYIGILALHRAGFRDNDGDGPYGYGRTEEEAIADLEAEAEAEGELLGVRGIPAASEV